MTTPAGPVVYNLFPRLLGPVSAWTAHLPRIAAMGFNWVFLNPVHYPGFSGSLYAVKDYYRLHPLFDDGSGRSADDQLRPFFEAAAAHGLSVMLDLVINHTAKDSPLVTEHRDWYLLDEQGEVVSPFAVDPDDPQKKTVWGDLAALDYRDRPERADIIAYFREVALHYVRLGCRGFRCDAAYQVPGEVWAPIIAAVRQLRPDTLFAAETLGCTPAQVMQLKPAGFDFLFNSVKWWNFRDAWLLEQYEAFRAIAPSIGFPESHDTPRLVTELDPGQDAAVAYRQRYLISAVFSAGVMIPIGYEYGFRTKLDVVTMEPAQWEAPAFDLSPFIAEVNRMRTAHRVFNEEGPQHRRGFEDESIVALVRRSLDGAACSLTIINTDRGAPHPVWTDELHDLPLEAFREVTPGRAPETIRRNGTVGLAPAEVRVFVSG